MGGPVTLAERRGRLERLGQLAAESPVRLSCRVTSLHGGGRREKPAPQTDLGGVSPPPSSGGQPLPVTRRAIGVPAVPSTAQLSAGEARPDSPWGHVSSQPRQAQSPSACPRGPRSPSCLLTLPQQQPVTHLTTGSRAPGTRPGDVMSPGYWAGVGWGRGSSEAPRVCGRGLSPSLGHFLLCTSPLPRSGAGASVAQLGVSSPSTAVL